MAVALFLFEARADSRVTRDCAHARKQTDDALRHARRAAHQKCPRYTALQPAGAHATAAPSGLDAAFSRSAASTSSAPPAAASTPALTANTRAIVCCVSIVSSVSLN